MKEKDKELQRIFDDFGDSLAPQPELSQRARQRFAENKNARKKFSHWGLVWCCAFLAVFVVGSTVFGVLAGQNNLNADSAVVYFKNQVAGKRISAAAAADIISTQKLDKTDYKVVSETYYAYYFKETDELAYVRGKLGVSTENGIVELDIVAESNKYVKKDFEEYYNSNANKPDSFCDAATDTDMSGEYVTSSFIHAEEMHFYVSSLGNPSTQEDVEKIIKLLFN